MNEDLLILSSFLLPFSLTIHNHPAIHHLFSSSNSIRDGTIRRVSIIGGEQTFYSVEILVPLIKNLYSSAQFPLQFHN